MQLLLDAGQILLCLGFLLGDALQLLPDVHQLRQRQIEGGVVGGHGDHTLQILRRLRLNLHLAGVGQPHNEVTSAGIDIRGLSDDEDLGLPGGRYVHLRAPGPDGGNGVLHRLHGVFLLSKGEALLILRPLGPDQEIALVGQRLPDFLGDEGHEGMQQLQHPQQHIAQHVLSRQLGLLVLAVQPGLGKLDVPVAIGVPNEVVDLGGGHAQFIGLHIIRDLPDEGIQLAENPLVLQLQLLR